MLKTTIESKYSANIGKIDIGSINIIEGAIFHKIVDQLTTIIVTVNISSNQQIDPDYVVLWAKSSTILPTIILDTKISSINGNVVTVVVPSKNLPQGTDIVYDLELALKI